MNRKSFMNYTPYTFPYEDDDVLENLTLYKISDDDKSAVLNALWTDTRNFLRRSHVEQLELTGDVGDH